MITSKQLDVPFIPDDGDGKQCVQACLRMLCEYHGISIHTWQEANELCQRKTGQWTWPYQVINAFLELGFHVEYYTDTDPSVYQTDEQGIKEIFGDDAEIILQHSDLSVIRQAITRMLKQNVTHIQILTEKDFEKYVDNDQPLLINIDWNVLQNKQGFQGHSVILTGYDDENFYIHHSGPKHPEANKAIPRKEFMRAYDTDPTDHDVIVVNK